MKQVSMNKQASGVPRLVVGTIIMWALVARRAVKAFSNPHRAFNTLPRSESSSLSFVATTRSGRLWSTLSPNELGELNEKIKVKGDEIRLLKANGVDKETLSPYIQELLALKAQIPEENGEKKTLKTKKKQSNDKSTKKSGAKSNKASQELTESELRQNRLAKVAAMRQVGVEPFEYSFDTTHTASQLHALYDDELENGQEDETADVAVAGRIITRRVFGKLAFFTLQDETGTIQLQFDKNRLAETFKVR